MTITTRLRTKHQRERAKQLIDRSPDDWVCVLREETRNDRQNRAMWGYIKQLREALPDTFGQFPPNDCKHRLLHALGAEMRFLPELDGAGMFPVGHHSSTLTVEQFSALLEIIQAYAAKHGVELKDA
jgi:hypothetical protein